MGLGRLLSPSGAWGGFSENTASHVWPSADSKSRFSLECFRTAAPAPSSAGNAIRHVPQALGPPRRHMGSHTHTHTNTEKQTCMCSYNHTHTPIIKHMQIHTYISHKCLSWGCEVDWFVAVGVRGQRNFTTRGGFGGFSHWDLNTTETPSFLFGIYQRTVDPLCLKGLQACQTPRKHLKIIVKN